jgi:hypothetical protein
LKLRIKLTQPIANNDGRLKTVIDADGGRGSQK